MALQKQVLILSAFALLAIGVVLYASPEDKIRPHLQEQTSLKCVDRSTIIARGQSWVDKNVPYSQTKTYDGYRTDCSGFVSMCWMLPKPGPSTGQFSGYSHSITKGDLQPGDAMCCPGHHIALFAKWSDSSKTHYVSMEEFDVGVGTVKKIVPYPYFNSNDCFKPIKSKTVC